jgi:hypothetical protein
MKTIISIRVDTLWKMLSQRKKGYFPEPYEEGATGKFDNKGAIFVPGGLIYKDVDEKPICYESKSGFTPNTFREKVYEAMQFDNATLLFPDGIATGVNLDSGFFSKAVRHIYSFRKAAFRRKKRIETDQHFTVNPDDIIRSHCPRYLPYPYGARTRISACVAVGLIDPSLFFIYCKTYFNFSIDQAKTFAQRLDSVQDAVKAEDGTIFYQPYLIVCHGARYKKNSLTGLTRILGIGKFGEFATFTFEPIDQTLMRELKRKQQTYTSEDIFVNNEGIGILGILRIYLQTQIGKRSQSYSIHIVSPEKDVGLKLDQIKQEAQERYHFHAD